MKKLLLILFVGIVFICGCSNNKFASNAGTYELEYSKYVGDKEDAIDTSKEELILNPDGTGYINRNNRMLELTWDIDGENISYSVKEEIMNQGYSGVIRNGKMEVFNGNPDDALTMKYVYNKK